ncbi:proteasome type-4 subunit beta [Vairimorpha ceranae]|uniref:Proteasome subunit beta n=1 Tax=Vairimorpha ceranae TaxID=40302 RepID=A0A0F9ZAG2_9MICR|nr:proteasome type-4 subunit beta [Vairimorpha ceranae]KAF5139668.1 hypothetical protein G9O61_00g021860 [Vairimorpha ceranae]KAF5139792.1 hypothetical protein G9O61_00g020430 [Vairimorpha ceranae]KKO74799.1 proteasome type-4 subunit beta [Vairimorpha ceranae]
MKNFVIGSGVISFKYKHGVITCTDTQASYGNLCKFNNVSRIFKLSDTTLMSLSGELSDIQYLVSTIKKESETDPVKMSTKGYSNLVQSILYNKRSKVEPLNVSVSVVGVDKEPYVSCINHLGNFYTDDIVCTGLANMIALPFLRSHNVTELERDKAVDLMEETMALMSYRSARSCNRIQIAIAEQNFISLLEPHVAKTNWRMGHNENEHIL